MNLEDRRRLERWALYLSLSLAGISVLFSVFYQSQMFYTAFKAVLTFLIMFAVCRIVIAIWDKVSPGPEPEKIKTTMDVLEKDLADQGIKVTYRPLDLNERRPGQLNMDALAMPDLDKQVNAVRTMMNEDEAKE